MRSLSTGLLLVLASHACGQQVQQNQHDRIQKLIRQVRQPQTRPTATLQLRSIGQPAVSPLLQSIRLEADKREGVEPFLALLAALEVLAPHIGAEPMRTLLTLHEKALWRRRQALIRTAVTIAPYSGTKAIEQIRMHLLRTGIGGKHKTEWYELRRLTARQHIDTEASERRLTEIVQAGNLHERCFAAELLAHRQSKSPTAHRALARELGKLPIEKVDTWQIRARFDGKGGVDDLQVVGSKALIRMAPNNPVAAIAYAHLLLYESNRLARLTAAMQLRSFGNKAEQAVPHLLHAMRLETDAIILTELISAIGAMGDSAQVALPALRKLQDHPNRRVRGRVKAAMIALGARH